jgi:hypothetical protein
MEVSGNTMWMESQGCPDLGKPHAADFCGFEGARLKCLQQCDAHCRK